MSFRMGTIFLLIMFWFGFPACQPATSDQPDQEKTTTNFAETLPTSTNKKPDEPLPFPVYEKFSDLAYIFQYQNDTTYVINFWATWCKPCVKELPYFEQLNRNLKTEKVKIILVSLDFAKDVATKLATFVENKQLQSQIIALTDGKYNDWIDKVHPDWSGAIPVTYIYKDSLVAFHDQQYDDYSELEKSVREVMGRQ